MLWEVLGDADPDAGAWLSMGWDQLKDGVLPPEVALGQLPRALLVDDSHYQIDYRVIGDEQSADKILIVLSDVTELVERGRREADQREHLAVFQHVVRDASAFEDFFNDSRRLAGRCWSAATPRPPTCCARSTR